ncbi:conserved oligomeric Golgi complex subunit 1 isoform X2 [Neocloeon triangulifer]|uniref:conserved oligomeric Golgi complex subunit 1 isoform X2 n=1 Tax=Neocloeon triangulifer TaxID=2078957 RepID=UPI00286ED02B|nr:conserved oligomeric Golgi complex subunit 1 isoform X2 [Neocloeon triangulifer]
MMPNHQYRSMVDLVPDKVFEENTVPEIKEILKKLQAEIERKKVEIRTMVGERYRDLIQAADTIKEMKDNSFEVIGQIDGMSDMCKQLQQVHLLGFRQDSEQARFKRNAANLAYYTVAVQVRILILIPEQIWSAIDEENYLLATQLFLFSSSVVNSLKLNIGNHSKDISSEKVLKCFPILEQQWESMKPFKNQIVKGCEEKIKRTELTDLEASECVVVLILLCGLSASQAQEKLLVLRLESLKSKLDGDHLNSNIKSQVTQSLKLAELTLTVFNTCFQETGSESFKDTLDQIVGQNSPPICTLASCLQPETIAILPPVVKNYKLSLAMPVELRSSADLEHMQSNWVKEVQTVVALKLGQLMNFVNTVHEIQSIREAVHSMLSKINRPKFGKLSVWEIAYRPLLTQRVREIIQNQTEQILSEMKTRLGQSLHELDQEKNLRKENDLRWFIWSEEAGDLPNSGGWMTQSTRTIDQAGGLLMKSLGYSPSIQKFCSTLDSSLQILLEDVMFYVNDGNLDIIASFIEMDKLRSEGKSDKFVDRNELQAHLQNCTLNSMKGILTFVKQKVEAMHGVNGETSLIFLGRLIQAICDLCPHLQKCMSPAAVWESNKPTLLGPLQAASAEWQQLCKKLESESLEILQIWAVAVSERLKQNLLPLQLDTSSCTLLQALTQWDIVKIEEEGEAGARLSSTIRVPAQPSLPLQMVLHNSCRDINTQVPHALPRQVHLELVESILMHLLLNYESLSKVDPMPQVAALQAVFDIRFIISLFILRDSKALNDKALSTCEQFEAKIDPFDLDVFQPYLQSNVKKSVYRLQHLLGCLVPPAKMAVLSGVRVGGIAGDSPSPDDPAALPMSSGAAWFPLLPVATPGLISGTSASVRAARVGENAQEKSKSKGKSSISSTSKSDNASSNLLVRSGAAALFGAMASSEWFGGSS